MSLRIQINVISNKRLLHVSFFSREVVFDDVNIRLRPLGGARDVHLNVIVGRQLALRRRQAYVTARRRNGRDVTGGELRFESTGLGVVLAPLNKTEHDVSDCRPAPPATSVVSKWGYAKMLQGIHEIF